MISNTKKVLLALLICSLPALGSAAENVPAAETPKTAAPVQAVQPAAAAQKTSETPKTAQALRIGYADIDKIQSGSALGKASLAQVKAKQEKLQSQIQTKEKQLVKQQDALKAKIASLSASQREAKAKEFQKKVEEFQKFGQSAEKELQNLKQELGKSFSEAVEQAAEEFGKTNGLALVVVKRELLYLSNGVDTQDASEGIIKLMDEKWHKK
jgi:outer membrane protein